MAEDEPLEVDAEDEGINYRGLAIQISDDLHDDDIDSLKFLSRDFVPGAKLERLKNTQDLFDVWEKNKKFGKNNPWYLAECLAKIQRFDLLEELGIEESELEERLQRGQSQISEYRKMLLEIAEDMDTEELNKMLYLIGDLKKKDRGKIKTTLNFFAYLEQTKLITPTNLMKLEEMLQTIDRNDLVDIIESYKEKTGLPANVGTEERMDTSDTNCPQLPQPSANDAKQKPPHRTIAEHPNAADQQHRTIAEQPPRHMTGQSVTHQLPHRTVAEQAPAVPVGQVAREVPLGVGYEANASGGLRVERALEVAGASPFDSPQEHFTQNVIVEPQLKDISDQVASEVTDNTWILFGYHLMLTPVFLQQISRKYPQMKERIFHLLTFWLHSWQSGYNEAITAIIDALHEVRIHHLAEQFDRIYRPEGMAEGVSLSSRSTTNQNNISVNTNEATYNFEEVAEPEDNPRMQPSQPALSESTTRQSHVAAVSEHRQNDNVLPVYKMEKYPRGLCIIINNEKFTKDPEDRGARKMPDREGTKVDAENLLTTFRDLYFRVHLHENLKATDMVRLMNETSLLIDHSQFDCFVCCVLSHGTQGHLYGSDGNLISISDLTAPLKTVSCPSLAGKPKLFFIQACQGREKQPGHEIERDGPSEIEEDAPPREVIPNEADFLIGYATVPGFVSYRSRTHGSWYVTKLCEMLDKYGRKYDLLSILLLVNNEVGKANAMMEGGRYKQSPAPLYTLRKKLIFT